MVSNKLVLILSLLFCAPLPAKENPTKKPKEACAKDIAVAAKLHCNEAAGDYGTDNVAFEVETIKDLNDDGSPEQLVVCIGICGATGNCARQLFIKKNECFVKAGDLGGIARRKVLSSKHHGYRDVVTYWKGGCAGREGGASYQEFDGKTYQSKRGVTCKCDTDKPDPKRPPECNIDFYDPR